jgi:hypothetical protein
MKQRGLVLTISAFILACVPIAASAQQGPSSPMVQTQQQPNAQENPSMMGQGRGRGPGMMGQGGMSGRGMMEEDMMGRGARHQGMMGPVVMRIIFALMDSDGDGTISLQEFQAAHERVFKAMDANKDGVLTPQEMQAFMHGSGKATPEQ